MYKLSMKDPIKTYDARWEVTQFNDQEVSRLFEATFGYARILGVNSLVFARDARLGAARVMEIGIESAIRFGFRVVACFDPVSTPLSYFMAMQNSRSHQRTMGLTVTASHNPSQYIGIKYTVPGVEAIGYDCGPLGGLTKVRELYHDTGFVMSEVAGGTLELIDHPASDYLQYSMNLAGVGKNDLTGLKIVLDTFNGSAGPELYKALTLCGVTVIPKRLVPNGEFPTGSPNPTSQHKMDETIELAKAVAADLVIGIDGDGDRIVFGDQIGLFSAGFVMIPILQSIVSGSETAEKPKILYDPKVNPLALSKWSELDTDPVLFRNGHSQIKGFMKEVGGLAGAEESGHFYHRLPFNDLQVSGENSLYTILLFLQCVKKEPTILKTVRAMQEQIYTSGEFNYYFPTVELRDMALAEVVQYFSGDGADLFTQSEGGIELEGTVLYKGVSNRQGKIILSQTWYAGYVRTATNENGIVRVYLSSSDAVYGDYIKSAVIQILKHRFKGEEAE